MSRFKLFIDGNRHCKIEKNLANKSTYYNALRRCTG